MQRLKILGLTVAKIGQTLLRLASQGCFYLVQQRHQISVIAGIVTLMVSDNNLELAIDSQLPVVALLEPGAGFHDPAFGIVKVTLTLVVRNAIVPFEVPLIARGSQRSGVLAGRRAGSDACGPCPVRALGGYFYRHRDRAGTGTATLA